MSWSFSSGPDASEEASQLKRTSVVPPSTTARWVATVGGRDLTFQWAVQAALSPLQRRALEALRRESILDVPHSPYSPAQRRAWLDALLMGDAATGDYVILSAALRETNVAYAELDLADGHVSGLFVSPACHRTGIGSCLFQAVESIVRGAGHTALSLSATPDAAAFYERCGCQRVSQLDLLLQGQVLPCIFFEKSLVPGIR